MMTSAKSGAVAAGHDATARTAISVLEDGGNAVDAVIAGLWAACVAEPVLASPGGGGFVMVRHGASGGISLIDFFAQTPISKRDENLVAFNPVFADFGTARQEFHIGHGASATPGFVPGLFDLHERFGTVPMAELLRPAAALAQDGVGVTDFQALLFEVVAPILTASTAAGKLFAPQGQLLKAGEFLKNPGLATLFDGLARGGISFFTSGPVSTSITEAQAEGGHLEMRDLEAYAVVSRAPAICAFYGAEIFLNPAPSAGGALIAHALGSYLKRGEKGPRALAYALGDTDKARRKIITEQSLLAQRGTTHISIVDRHGNAAAATVTNGEGNGEIVGDYGFMLNNMLGEADINPGGFHAWPENRRMISMMAPTLVVDQSGGLTALGSGGSNRIRSAIFQVIARLVAEGFSPADAVAAARLHVEDGHLDFEAIVGHEHEQELAAAFPGYRAWPEPNLFFGGVHVAGRDGSGAFKGAGDPRRAGVFDIA